MKRLAHAILPAAVFGLLANPAQAQERYEMMWGHGWGTGGWVFGGILMLLFWAGVIALIILAIRTFTSSSSRPPVSTGPSSADHSIQALGILSERYARGEIDKDEFDERRATLLSLSQKENEMP